MLLLSFSLCDDKTRGDDVVTVLTKFITPTTTLECPVTVLTKVSTKVTVNDILPSTKVSCSFRIPDHKSGKDSPFSEATETPVSKLLNKVKKTASGIPKHHKKVMGNYNYYIIWVGKKPGIFCTWKECKDLTKWARNATFKKYNTIAEAVDAIRKSPPHDPMINPPTWPYDVPLEAKLLMFGEGPGFYFSEGSGSSFSEESGSSYRHTNANDVKATINLKDHKVIVEGDVDAISKLMSNLLLK